MEQIKPEVLPIKLQMSCEDQAPISHKCLFNKARQGLLRELKQSKNLQIILFLNLILAGRAVPQPFPCPELELAS